MPSILVVDDSEVHRRLAGGLVERSLDAQVIYATNGIEALEQIEMNYPDIVITDVLMPEMNGLELVLAVRDEYPFIPVIVMTAEGNEDVSAEALRNGAASYIPKNKLAEYLPDALQHILAASREDRAHSRVMNYASENDTVFEIPNDLDLIHSLAGHLQQMLRCLPLAEETERLRVSIAIEEALTNAYYHGNLEVGVVRGSVDHEAAMELAKRRRSELPYSQRKIHVLAQITRDEAVFVIRDEGPGFDTSKLADAGDSEEGRPSIGRGFRLMRSIMDDVKFNDVGNEVTLIKRSDIKLAEGFREKIPEKQEF